jgi:hypothetical protein
MTLNPATAALSTVPTWTSALACPAADVSAEVNMYSLSGTLESSVSGVQTAGITTAGFTGSGTGLLLGSVGSLLSSASPAISATAPGTVEWVVDCYSGAGATGTVTHEGSTFVSVASGATVYTTSATAPAQTATTTTLVAATNPAGAGVSDTLTATESPATAGTMTFMNGATVIASGVAVNATTGVATTSFTTPTPFTSALSLSATFTPTSQSFSGSTGNLTLNTNAVNTAINSPVAVTFTVAASGSLTVTVATPATASLSGTFPNFTGTLPGVTISDTRNTAPGWSVLGQEGTFTANPATTPNTPISGNQLGWVPAQATTSVGTFDGTHVVLGGTVTAASPGLGTTAAQLALAHAGFGADPSGVTTYTATATLNLIVPASTSAGNYAGSLTITYLSSQA